MLGRRIAGKDVTQAADTQRFNPVYPKSKAMLFIILFLLFFIEPLIEYKLTGKWAAMGFKEIKKMEGQRSSLTNSITPDQNQKVPS